jgi:pyrroloquinoline-quinone synthase
METKTFLSLLDENIRQYDLLKHPFYQAWSEGKLTRTDLREYAADYYPHVESFPGYLGKFADRLEDGELRRSVVVNMNDELGEDRSSDGAGRPHSELWLDFVEGMGGNSDSRTIAPEIAELIGWFQTIAEEGTPEEALAAFYAYESQVPRVAEEKNRGLRDLYGADEKARGYFTLHATADVYHSQVWRKQLRKKVQENPDTTERALAAAEMAASKLWSALDGVEARRLERVAA